MSYELKLIKDPASYQTPAKLATIANKINRALIKKKIKGITSCELVADPDGDFSIYLSFFNETRSDNTAAHIYSWHSDDLAKEVCDFFILYLKGKKTFSEMAKKAELH